MKKQIEGYTGYEKDTVNGAIVNTDLNTYNILKKRKENRIRQTKEFSELKNKVDTLTSLVEKLIEKVDK
jgi:hypothetical protein